MGELSGVILDNLRSFTSREFLSYAVYTVNCTQYCTSMHLLTEHYVPHLGISTDNVIEKHIIKTGAKALVPQ